MKMENGEENINALLTDLVGCRLSANTLMCHNLSAVCALYTSTQYTVD